MRPSSSTSEQASPGGLLAPLFTAADVEAELDDRALLSAMLEVERELAAAQAELGLVPAAAAADIAGASRRLALDLDPADLGRRALGPGNPVNPLVRELTAAVPAAARPYVHLGTTSQDVLDTALMLCAKRSGRRTRQALDQAADACAALTTQHRMTPMTARTLGQQALPTTVGLKAAGWLVALDDAAGRLAAVLATRLAVQLGGAAGTLAGLDESGPELVARLARRLGLAEPVLPWHTDRQRLLDLSAALAGAVGAAGKIALDLTLLAQTEVAEILPASGGGSTAMPHKQNPVDAILIRSSALRAPGLLAALFTAAGQHEYERAAGAWHAEWEPLRELLSLAGGSAHRLAGLLPGLRIDPEQMRRNLDRTDGLLLSESVAGRLSGRLGRDAAHDLVQGATRRATESGRPFAEVLGEDQQVRAVLSDEDLAEALDPQNWLGATDALIERALAAHSRRAEEQR